MLHSGGSVFPVINTGTHTTEHSTFHISTLMMEVETVSEMIDADPILTQLVIQEGVIGFKTEVINYSNPTHSK
jgi:hypothetical protein